MLSNGKQFEKRIAPITLSGLGSYISGKRCEKYIAPITLNELTADSPIKRAEHTIEGSRKGNDLPDVLGVRELAAYLGVGKNTAYDLIHSEQIQAVQVGRQYRIRKEAVLEFLGGKK